MVAQVNMLKGVTKKVDDTLEIYHFFLDGYWNYENKKIVQVLQMVSPEE
jgi:hypothetical protein